MIIIGLILLSILSVMNYFVDFEHADHELKQYIGYGNRRAFDVRIISVRHNDDYSSFYFVHHTQPESLKGYRGSFYINEFSSDLEGGASLLQPGSVVTVEGFYEPFKSYYNPGSVHPDISRLSSQRLGRFNYRGLSESGRGPHILIRQGIAYRTTVYNKLIETIHRIYPESLAGLLKAMILGDKATMNEDLVSGFRNHGLSHLLAISGLHVSILFLSTLKLNQFITRSSRFAYWITVLLMTGYNFLIGYHVSCIRATLMMSIYYYAITYEKPHHNLRCFFLVLAANLMIHPNDLFNAGFLLSYSAVASLYLIFPALKSMTQTFIHPGILKSIIELGLVTISVNIGTLPILLIFFKGFALTSLIANLLLVPLFLYLYLAGIVSVLFGLLSLGIGQFISGSFRVIFSLYELFIDIMDNKGFLYVGKPNLMVVIAYYLIVVIIVRWMGNYGKLETKVEDIKSNEIS